MITLLIIVGLILLTLFGTPLFVIISGIALLLFHLAEIDSSAIIIELYRLTSQPIFLAIPLFTFAGYLLAESNTPRRLVNLSRALIGWLPAGLAIVALVSSALFTAFTGASGVTIIALGGLLHPIMLREKYPEKFTLGLLTASGNLGLLLPPSLPIILYGLVAQTPIDQLFAAGIVPSILMIVMLSIYIILFRRKQLKELKIRKSTRQERWQALKESAWEIPLPFIIIGGIYGGLFTATEAAAVTAIYVFIIEVFIYRDISLRRGLPVVVRKSMEMVGSIIVILAAALGLANYFTDAQIPMRILEAMKTFIDSPIVFLLFLNLFLLLVGAVMDIFSAIMVIVPIIIPIAASFGIDPVHLGIIFLANLGIGYSTPPVGMNLFIASLRFEKSITFLYRAALPFLIILLIALALITYIPALSIGILPLIM
ncbi:TRAP dicarboxylate transporter, DctM subunit [Caldithrix abyssi DSM 13497]|uniref:TRAP dicarboxylate transporter, DctM subunit n=1 Tax=Caldithrix abyssi DSM 13497 TaxID=880073 RepID=H1XYM9_CALAY|nr:TRAP transporter large permease subunit [Caldithrix abyssi]APF19742.1 TRAP transporter, DctM subunit [Caldithrix abyssi DSM 13497]EHO39847.1 TRAP dicarboxylate transporter, DctM subunit [Caldithrix abyssi DSM 13497]